ncbi:MAG: hypothetical protein R3341_07455 [Methylophaga sp.]|nr:hypothetical protein [Methylophaga sp.]
MNYQIVLRITAILGLLIGLVMLFSVNGPMGVFSADNSIDYNNYHSQLYGSALIGFAVLNWLASPNGNEGEIRTVLLANLITVAISFLVSLYQQLIVGAGFLNWFIVIIFLLLSIAYLSSIRARGRIKDSGKT